MPKHQHQREQLRGRVLSLNFSPKGDVEGCLLHTGQGTVQVNLPKEAGQAPRVGTDVTFQVEAEEEGGEHPVYRLSDDAASISGEVVRLNYTRRGEANGFVLADGPFVHLKPDGMREHRVRVGDRVSVTGTRRQGTATEVVEASSLKRERT